MSDIVCWMSKEGNRKEAKVFVFEDPDEKHRRESVGECGRRECVGWRR